MLEIKAKVVFWVLTKKTKISVLIFGVFKVWWGLVLFGPKQMNLFSSWGISKGCLWYELDPLSVWAGGQS